jgi:hypothetical protein
MVGRMDDQKHCYFQQSEVNVHNLISNSNGVQWTESVKERLSLLDTKWLLESGVPSLTISTGSHLDYHKFSDDAQYINWNGMNSIYRDLKWWLINTYR